MSLVITRRTKFKYLWYKEVCLPWILEGYGDEFVKYLLNKKKLL